MHLLTLQRFLEDLLHPLPAKRAGDDRIYVALGVGRFNGSFLENDAKSSHSSSCARMTTRMLRQPRVWFGGFLLATTRPWILRN